ncbi:DsrE family protein [Streptomyces sp. NBRC 109706]|uniref:DsrE family protein n=1 Tax=Streptomyces sp. NBRC 109706 TaxID=1550035 RepID=UPI00078535FF|nr:DsrE family protein [Streptomyces sp. NBRC 109706]
MSNPTTAATAHFLLIETRTPGALEDDGLLGDGLAQAEIGHQVTLFLIQDAVAWTLPTHAPLLGRLSAAGVRIWVDDFSLTQRGLAGRALPHGATQVTMDDVAEAVLAPEIRVVWH